MEDLENIYDVIIIGSGPAGYTAGIYCSRANLKTLVFEGDTMPGGQLTTTTEVENFPGFPNGIGGYELTQHFKEHCKKFGAILLEENVISVSIGNNKNFYINTKTNIFQTKSVIIATGATAKKLTFPGSDTYFNKGISACAVCDGALPIFRKKPLAVIGGGDTAMEEALFLTKYASIVYIIHRRDNFRASKIMQNRVFKLEEEGKIKILWNKEVKRALGDSKLKSIILIDTITTDESELEVNGLFFAIGHKPASECVENLVSLDENGYIRTDPGTTYTSVHGIFACGDVQDKKYRQAITAAGSGCMAALDVCHYLETIK